MSTQIPVPSRIGNFVARHPAVTYFVLTFAVSWLGAFAVAAPHLLRGEAIPKFAGLMMFPAMLLGPSGVGILLTWFIDGGIGLRDLFSRMRHVRVSSRWFAPLLIPPILVLTVLFIMKTFVSPVFAPNRFLIGISFGFVAGFFEEIGWMGYAFPRMRRGGQRPSFGNPARPALGSLAHPRHRLPGNLHSPRRLLVSLFSRLHCRPDRHARTDRVDLLQREKRPARPTSARQLHGLSRHLQPSWCNCRARVAVVRRLCRRLVARRRYCRHGIR